MKKIMSILLVLLMLTSVLASCGGNDETTTTEVPTTETPTTEAPTTEAPTTEVPTTEIPTTEAPTTEAPTTEAPTTEAPTTEPPSTEVPKNTWSSKTDIRDTWSGKTLNVACSTWYVLGAPWAMPEVFVTEENDAEFGEEIQKAVLDRNEFIENTYGVKVNWINATKSSMPKALEAAILAGNINYDLAAPRMMNAQAIVTRGYVYDLANREFIDFKNSYYREESIKTYTAHGHTFFVTGGFSNLDMETASVLYFNKTLLPGETEEITNDIYDMVRKGEWTFDKLFTYLEASYFDNGSGFDRNSDTLGASFLLDSYYDYFGIKSAGINESTGNWELTINDERIDDVISAIIRSNTAPELVINEDTDYYNSFNRNQVVFLTDVLNKANDFENVGIVPFPMLNKEQGRYYAPCSIQFSVAMCIPKITQDRNMSEYFMDVLCWTGEEYIIKTYIDNKTDLFETDAEKEMITEYIIPNISYDAGASVGWGTLINIKSDSYEGNENHFDEVYDRKAPAALKTIEEWNNSWSSYVEDDTRPTPPITGTPAHIHKETVIKGRNATATQTGLTDGVKCIECGKILRHQSVIPALEIVDGLKYRLNEDDPSYAIIGLGDYTDKNLVIPSKYNGFPVTRIDKNAFKNNESILSVTIPSSVNYIGVSAFEGCIGITSVELSEGITYIGNHAFNGCTSLEKIKMPSTVLNTGLGVFANCTSLKSVEISSGIKRINNHMFSNCSALTTVIIPDSVTEIGVGVFSDCEGLTTVPMGNNVSIIEAYAFFNCDGLTSVGIGNKVSIISEGAFENCDSITEIIIPENVTHIGENSFYNCKGLTRLVIGSGVTYIERMAFGDCTKLTYAEFKVKDGWYIKYSGEPAPLPLSLKDPSIVAGHISGNYGRYNWIDWFRE